MFIQNKNKILTGLLTVSFGQDRSTGAVDRPSLGGYFFSLPLPADRSGRPTVVGLLSVCAGRPDRSTGRRVDCFQLTLYKALISLFSLLTRRLLLPSSLKNSKNLFQPSPPQSNLISSLKFLGSSLSGLDFRLFQGFSDFSTCFSIFQGKNPLLPRSCFITCSLSYSKSRSSYHIYILCRSSPFL